MTNLLALPRTSNRPEVPITPSDPRRRRLSPRAENRNGDLWRVRIGLIVATSVSIASAAVATHLFH
jgi:hypothetical protein